MSFSHKPIPVPVWVLTILLSLAGGWVLKTCDKFTQDQSQTVTAIYGVSAQIAQVAAEQKNIRELFGEKFSNLKERVDQHERMLSKTP